MSEFDIKANEWDKNNVHLVRNREIANQLLEIIPFKPGMKVMEFGAGTALLSFMLEDLFTSVTLIDNSVEMIRICNEKIAQTKSNHLKAIKIDLETEYFEDKFQYDEVLKLPVKGEYAGPKDPPEIKKRDGFAKTYCDGCQCKH